MTNTYYKHYKKGGTYSVLFPCEMQINQQWFEAICYKSIETGKIYCREISSFDNSFKVVEG